MAALVPWEQLFEAAEAARQRAHAPYSHFQVGAALLTDDGRVVSGCNVENASYGLTVCAERNAVGALALTGRRVVAVAIVTHAAAPTPPCGACRQVLLEFADAALPVRSRAAAGVERGWTLGELLPHAFTRSSL